MTSSQRRITRRFVNRSHDGIGNKEMHLASKSASSGKHKILIRFYLKSDRFGDFWASGRSEGIRSDFGTCRAVVASGQRRTARRLASGPRKCKKNIRFLMVYGHFALNSLGFFYTFEM